MKRFTRSRRSIFRSVPGRLAFLFLLAACCGLSARGQDSLRFISGTTGAACQVIKYHNGYLYAGTGSTLRVYKITSHLPYQLVFEYRYKSAIIDMQVREDFLYVAANYDGLIKWNITFPTGPMVAFTIPADDNMPLLNFSISGDTIFAARLGKVTAYKDKGDFYYGIGDFGSVSGTARVLGTAVKNGICAVAVSDAFSEQNGIYLYRTSDFSFLSHYAQTFCCPENVIWGQQNDILHVLGGTNGVNGSFYSLDVSDVFQPQQIFSDTIPGIPFGLAVANPIKAVNINDTIYVATTAGMKPNGPIDTCFVYVYDATDAANVHRIGYIPAGLWHFDLDMNYPECYIASEWYGIKTVDYSLFPQSVDLGNTPTGGWNTGSDKYGNNLVVANEGYGFKLFDVTQVYKPAFLKANTDPGFCIRTKFSEDGNYIYTANTTYDGFRVYDAATLSKVGTIPQYSGTGKMLVNHDRIYLLQQVLGNWLNVINAVDPSNPFMERKVASLINDMAVSDEKLFIANDDSIIVYDIRLGNLDRIAFLSLPLLQDAKTVAVYDNEVFVYISPTGLTRYRLDNTGGNWTLAETGTFSLEGGAPLLMAADSFGLYVAYRVNGLYSYDRFSLVQKGYFRGESDTKGYNGQYGTQDLYCRDNLVLLSEYFSQTSILTQDNHYPFGIRENGDTNRERIQVSPNPFHTKATLSIPASLTPENWELSIVDTFGRTVRKITGISSHFPSLDRNDLANGIYFFRLTGGNKVIGTGKCVIY
jgi:hypothetical protein